MRSAWYADGQPVQKGGGAVYLFRLEGREGLAVFLWQSTGLTVLDR